MEALVEFLQSFPNGYIPFESSGEANCGIQALVGSLKAQHKRITAPSEQELVDIAAELKNNPSKHGWRINQQNNAENSLINQLAAIIQAWSKAKLNSTVIQLGFILQEQPHKPVQFSVPESISVLKLWIGINHNCSIGSEKKTSQYFSLAATPNTRHDPVTDNFEDLYNYASEYDRVTSKIRQAMHDGHVAPTLVLVGGNILPATPAETIRGIGNSLAPGLHTQCQTRTDQCTPDCIVTQISICDGQNLEPVLEITTPLADAAVKTFSLDTEKNIQILNGFFPVSAPEVSESELQIDLNPSPKQQQAAVEEAARKWHKSPDSLTDAEFMYQKAPRVVFLQVSALSSIHLIARDTLCSNTTCLNHHTHKVYTMLKSLLHTLREKVTWTFVLPDHGKWLNELDNTSKINSSSDSSTSDFMNYCVRLKHLGKGKRNFSAVSGPKTPIPPAMLFHNKEHYAVTHTVAQAQQAHAKISRADTRQCIFYNFVAMKVPGSEWKRTNSDEAVYGVKADGEPSTYLLVLLSSKQENLALPDINDTVEIYLDCEQTTHLPPYLSPEPTSHDFVASHCFDGVKRAQYQDIKAAMKPTSKIREDRNIQSKSQHAIAYNMSDAPDVTLEEVDACVDEDAFLADQFCKRNSEETPSFTNIRSTLENNISNKHVLHQHYVTVAPTWRQGYYEKHDTYLERIRTWVFRQNISALQNKNDKVDPPFIGRRIAQPAGAPAGLVFLEVKRPTQEGWPSCFKAPYVRVNLPTIMHQDSFENFVPDLAALESLTISGCISSSSSDSAVEAACSAIRNLISAEKDTVTDSLMHYLLSFRDFPSKHRMNLHACYPGLGQYYQSLEVTSPTKEAFGALSDTIGGTVIVVGGPGTGKTEFAFQIAEKALRGGYLPDAGWKSPSASELALREANIVGDAYPFGKVDASEKPTDEQVKMLTVAQPKTAAKPRQPDLSIGWGKCDAIRPQPDMKSVVIWASAQNSQFSDVIARFTADPYNFECIRAYAVNLEMENIFNADRCEVSNGRSGVQNTTTSDNEAQTWSNTGLNPSTDNHSWSNVAKRILSENPDRWPILFRKIAFHEDKPQWEILKEEAVKEARALLDYVLRYKSDAVFCTPVVAAEIANHHPKFRPILKVIDDAGRLPEPLSLVLESRWQGIPCFYLGDPNIALRLNPPIKASRRKSRHTMALCP